MGIDNNIIAAFGTINLGSNCHQYLFNLKVLGTIEGATTAIDGNSFIVIGKLSLGKVNLSSVYLFLIVNLCSVFLAPWIHTRACLQSHHLFLQPTATTHQGESVWIAIQYDTEIKLFKIPVNVMLHCYACQGNHRVGICTSRTHKLIFMQGRVCCTNIGLKDASSPTPFFNNNQGCIDWYKTTTTNLIWSTYKKVFILGSSPFIPLLVTSTVGYEGD